MMEVEVAMVWYKAHNQSVERSPAVAAHLEAR